MERPFSGVNRPGRMVGSETKTRRNFRSPWGHGIFFRLYTSIQLEARPKYRGKFDAGWDKLREETLVRQKKLGVVPADCELTARHKEIPAWDEMPRRSSLCCAGRWRSTQASWNTLTITWAGCWTC